MIVFVFFLIAAASASPYLNAGPLFAFYPYGYGLGASSAQAQAGSYSGGYGGGSSSQAIAASLSQSGHGIVSSGASAASQAQSIGYPLGRSRRASSDEESTEMRYKGPHRGPETLSRGTESVKPVYESEPYDEENEEDIASSHPKPIITTHGAMSGSCASGLCTPLTKGGEAITSSVISQPSPLVGPYVRDASENEEVSDAHADEEELRETDVLDPLYIRTPSEHSTRDPRCTTCADALSTSSASANSGVTEKAPGWEKGYGGFGGSQSSSGSFAQASAMSGSYSSSGGSSSNTGFGGGSSGSSSFSSAGASSSGQGGSVVSGAGTCATGLGGCIGTGTGYSSGSGGFGVIQSSIGSKPNQGFSSGSPIKPGFVVSQGYGSGSQGYGGSSQGYGGVSQGYGGSSPGYGGVSQGYGVSSQGYGGVSQGYGGSSSYGGYSGSNYQSSPIPPLANQGSSGFISGVSTNRPTSGGSFGPISSFGSGGNLVSGTGSQFSSGAFSGANSGAQAGGLSGPQAFPTGGSFTPGVGTSNIGVSSGSLSGAGANSGTSSFGGGSQNSGIGGGISSSFSGAQSGGGAGGFGSLGGVNSPIITGSAFNTASSSSSSSSSSSNSNTSSSGFFGASFGR